MRILILSHQVPNPHSGATIRMYYFLKYLKRIFGHEIYLVSFYTERTEEYLQDIIKFCDDILLLRLCDAKNSRAIMLKVIRNLVRFIAKRPFYPTKNGCFDVSFYYSYDYQGEIDRFLNRHNIDLILSDSGMAAYLARARTLKFVDAVDINYRNWFYYAKTKKSILTKIYWLLRTMQTLFREVYIYNKYDGVIVVSEEDKRSITNFHSHVYVIPNGTDIHYFTPLRIDKKPREPILVYTGVMNAEKNIEAVLFFYNEIYRKIKKLVPNVRFYIVGKSPANEIKALSKDESVIVTGFVDDIRHFLRKALIFVCPIISGTGIKNKVLEAMAMGIPVIATPIGIIGINAKHKVNVIIARDQNAFIEWIVKLLEDEKLRVSIGRNARRLVETVYAWEVIVNRLNDLILSKKVKTNP